MVALLFLKKKHITTLRFSGANSTVKIAEYLVLYFQFKYSKVCN